MASWKRRSGCPDFANGEPWPITRDICPFTSWKNRNGRKGELVDENGNEDFDMRCIAGDYDFVHGPRQ
jgi:hypothetical protein